MLAKMTNESHIRAFEPRSVVGWDYESAQTTLTVYFEHRPPLSLHGDQAVLLHDWLDNRSSEVRRPAEGYTWPAIGQP